MYEILRRSPERPWALANAASSCRPIRPSGAEGLALHLRENRRRLSEPARQAITRVSLLMAACAILPALHGLWLMAADMLGTLAALTFALEHHGRAQPAGETRTIADGNIRHRVANGQVSVLPCRLEAEAFTPASPNCAAPAPMPGHAWSRMALRVP